MRLRGDRFTGEGQFNNPNCTFVQEFHRIAASCCAFFSTVQKEHSLFKEKAIQIYPLVASALFSAMSMQHAHASGRRANFLGFKALCEHSACLCCIEHELQGIFSLAHDSVLDIPATSAAHAGVNRDLWLGLLHLARFQHFIPDEMDHWNMLEEYVASLKELEAWGKQGGCPEDLYIKHDIDVVGAMAHEWAEWDARNASQTDNESFWPVTFGEHELAVPTNEIGTLMRMRCSAWTGSGLAPRLAMSGDDGRGRICVIQCDKNERLRWGDFA